MNSRHSTYQTGFVSAGQGGELVVRLGQLEIAFNVRGGESVFVPQSVSVVLVWEQVLGCREGFQAGGIVEARGRSVGAELR